MNDTQKRMYAPASYYDGFMSGVTQTDNDVPLFVFCFQPDEDLSDNLFDAFEALTEGDTKKGNELLEESKPEFYKAMEKCDPLYEEILIMHSRYEEILQRPDAVEFQRQNARRNRQSIKENYEQAIADWNSQNPKETGKHMGNIMRLTVGDIAYRG